MDAGKARCWTTLLSPSPPASLGDWWAPSRREACRTRGSLTPGSYIKDALAPGLRCHKHEDKFLIPSKKMPGDGGAQEKNELGFYYVFYYAVIEQD